MVHKNDGNDDIFHLDICFSSLISGRPFFYWLLNIGTLLNFQFHQVLRRVQNVMY